MEKAISSVNIIHGMVRANDSNSTRGGRGTFSANGLFGGQFGYNADTYSCCHMAVAVLDLDVTYEFSDDYYEATNQLFEEIAKIRSLVPMNSVERDVD